MELKKICLRDGNFGHQQYTSPKIFSKYIKWDRGCPNGENNGPVFMVDGGMLGSKDLIYGKKIGWLMEPRFIDGGIYNWVRDNYHQFDKVLTFDKEFLLLDREKFVFYPFAGSWVSVEHHAVYNKSKLVSIIASGKNSTIGHRLRHESISELKNNNISIDTFGYGYNPVQNKVDALKDYAFSIVIENSKFDYYFTEKIIDAFVTGTVPIYWGCPSIGRFFDTKGMIIFNTVEELVSILQNLTFEKYVEMLPYVKNNFEEAKKYLLAEDWIYENTNLFLI